MAKTSTDAGDLMNHLTHLLDRLLGLRFWALFLKEVNQIRRNRRLMVQILVPPTVLLLLFGFALNPEFQDLKVGIINYSSSRASREFVELFSQTDAFAVHQQYSDQQSMTTDLATGKLGVGIVIPPEFDNDIARNRPAQVQILYDAVDANTASVASGYISQLIQDYNTRHQSDRVDAETRRSQIQVQTSVFYNPGLETSWFITSGVIGVVLTIIGSQVASSLVVREKEAGTIEQLMMTPASNTEVILAKVAPLLVLLIFDALLALFLIRTVFHVPFRGSLFVFLAIGIVYFWISISIGILLASSAKTEQQAQLMAFFINPPLVLLSGATTPTSSMPTVVQWLSYLDPLRYFIEVSRGVLLKGVGFEMLWMQVLILLSFATVLMILGIRQFRKQLS
jgi:ABC-2 type transport system permease protein